MDDVCLMAYTSGSTGLPKGAMISFECALYKTAVSADGFRLGDGDVMLADVALHHISGMITGLALPISIMSAFFAMWICGFTVNTMTLLALSLAIGLLIDVAMRVRGFW